MSQGRFKDREWDLRANGENLTWDRVPMALLMDIRDELKRLNSAIYCNNALAIPGLLRAIKTNTTKPKKRRTKA